MRFFIKPIYAAVLFLFSLTLSASNLSNIKEQEEKVSYFQDDLSGQKVSIHWNSSDYINQLEPNDIECSELTAYDLVDLKSDKIRDGFCFLHAVVWNESSSAVSFKATNIIPKISFLEKQINASVEVIYKPSKSIKTLKESFTANDEITGKNIDLNEKEYSFFTRYYSFSKEHNVGAEQQSKNDSVVVSPYKAILVKWYVKLKGDSAPSYKLLKTKTMPPCHCPSCGSCESMVWDSKQSSLFEKFVLLDCPSKITRNDQKITECFQVLSSMKIYLSDNPICFFKEWNNRRFTANLQDMVTRVRKFL